MVMKNDKEKIAIEWKGYWKMDERKEILKLCPFCGGEVMLHIDRAAYKPFYILCDCGAIIGYFVTKEEAIKVWNSRVCNCCF